MKDFFSYFAAQGPTTIKLISPPARLVKNTIRAFRFDVVNKHRPLSILCNEK